MEIIAALADHGLLLKTDPKLPNVCALVTGATVRGSWWAHPQSHEIFRVLTKLGTHEDVLAAKLVSGKDTFIHRTLWAAVVSIGTAREPWQMNELDREARALLAVIDKSGQTQASGKAALRLERTLLVQAQQIHTSAGSHAKALASWRTWATPRGIGTMDVGEAKATIEKAVDHLNRRYGGAGRLPWLGTRTAR